MLKILFNQYFWLIIILLVAFALRLYKIDSQLADWHSWRQADTAAVTRNFIKESFNPLIPKDDDLSGISERPITNLNRFRFVEFPIYNIVTYPFYLLFGIDDKYSRLVSILFSLGSIIFLYLICKKYLGIITALLTAAIYAFLPFNIFFSRTTLPEPTFLFFALGMVYFVDRVIWDRRVMWVIWGFIFMTVAFLIKPWAIFFIPPLIYSVINREKSFKKSLKYLFFPVLAVLPFILWRLWILQAPEGIPASSWLMNSDGIRFRPAFWWWLVSERIGREILGVSGAFLFFLGIILRPKNGSPRFAGETGNYFLHIWLISLFSYFTIFATGNVRHDYYQYIFVPVAAVFIGLGFVKLISGEKVFLPRIWTITLALIFLPLTFYFSWIQVKELYKINNPAIVEAGKLADQILPKEAVVVAPYNGDTAFLYQINRTGFPFTPLPLTDLVADYGVTHFISTSRDDKTNWVLRHFKILQDNPRFIIADLTILEKPIADDLEP